MPFSDGTADFRSDTVTRPTAEMYEAMVSAPLGDDVYHDDPTVLTLEEESALSVGKEAAIFVPTGTMGNQLAVMVHTSPGEEVIVSGSGHLRSIEKGAAQALSGVAFRNVERSAGRILPEDVEAAMEMSGFFPRIGLMTWENTHNMSGGRVVPFELMEQTSSKARDLGLRIHIDGARMWNAVSATGIDGPEWGMLGDTVQFCFSKGLGAPVGSILCGDEETIQEVRYLRGRMGGSMRQAGVLAAAALVGLRARDRLGEDHLLAEKLAVGLNERFPGSVKLDEVDTNIVNVDFRSLGQDWTAVATALSDSGIKANPPLASRWRLVTHRDVDESDVEHLLEALG